MSNQEIVYQFLQQPWSKALCSQTLLSLDSKQQDFDRCAIQILESWQLPPSDMTEGIRTVAQKIPGAGYVSSALSSPVGKFFTTLLPINSFDLPASRRAWFEYCYCQNRVVTPELWFAFQMDASDLEFFVTKYNALYRILIGRDDCHPLLKIWIQDYPKEAELIVNEAFEIFSSEQLRNAFYDTPPTSTQVTASLKFLDNIREFVGKNFNAISFNAHCVAACRRIWDSMLITSFPSMQKYLKSISQPLMSMVTTFHPDEVRLMLLQWEELVMKQNKFSDDYLENYLLTHLRQYSSQITDPLRVQVMTALCRNKKRLSLADWKTLKFNEYHIQEFMKQLPALFDDLIETNTPECREVLMWLAQISPKFRDFLYNRCLDTMVSVAADPTKAYPWMEFSQAITKFQPGRKIVDTWCALVVQPNAKHLTDVSLHRQLLPHLEATRKDNVAAYHEQHRAILEFANRHQFVIPDELLRHLNYDKEDFFWMIEKMPEVLESWLGEADSVWSQCLKTFSQDELQRYRRLYLDFCYRNNRPISMKLWAQFNSDENDIDYIFKKIPNATTVLTGSSWAIWHENLIALATLTIPNTIMLNRLLWAEWVPSIRALPEPIILFLGHLLRAQPDLDQNHLDALMNAYFALQNRLDTTLFDNCLLPYCQTHQEALSAEFKLRWVRQLLTAKNLGCANKLIAIFNIEGDADITPEDKFALVKQRKEIQPNAPQEGLMSPTDVSPMVKDRMREDRELPLSDLEALREVSPHFYFEVVSDQEFTLPQLLPLNGLYPYNQFPEETEDNQLPDQYVRKLLLDHKKPVESTMRYHAAIIQEYEAFITACEKARRNHSPNGKALERFILGDPARVVTWLNALSAQGVTSIIQTLPWLETVLTQDRRFDEAKLMVQANNKTVHGYAIDYNPRNTMLSDYDKCLNVLKAYCNPARVIFGFHWQRHHLPRIRLFIKAEKNYPNEEKTPEKLMERFDNMLENNEDVVFKEDGDLMKRKVFIEGLSRK